MLGSQEKKKKGRGESSKISRMAVRAKDRATVKGREGWEGTSPNLGP